MTVSRHYAPRGDRTALRYLGYRLEVTNRDVTVRDKQGRKLVTVASIPAARNFVRGYRREPSNVKTEPGRQTREGDDRAPTARSVDA